MNVDAEPPDYAVASTTASVANDGVLISRLIGVKCAGFEQGTLLQTAHYDYHLAANAFEDAATVTETINARPHPHAFYSPAVQGWTLACLWPNINDGKPATNVAVAMGKCTVLGPTTNAPYPAHHFVARDRQVDPAKLLRFGSSPNRARLGDPTVEPFISGKEFPDAFQGANSTTARHDYLTTYSCSMDPSLTLAVSQQGAIECIASRDIVQRFEQHRLQNPAIDATSNNPNVTLHAAWELIWRIIDNVLQRGETRSMKFTSPKIHKYIGIDQTALDLFRAYGFNCREAVSQIEMPQVDKDVNPQGRLLLIRAWLETAITAWHYKVLMTQTEEMKGKKVNHSPQKSNQQVNLDPPHSIRLEACLLISDARDTISTLLGGNHYFQDLFFPVNQAERPTGKSSWNTVGNVNQNHIHSSYKLLGCTPLESDSLVKFAFDRQVICKPESAPKYLSALIKIADDSGSDELTMAAVEAQSAGIVPAEEINAAYATLGFDPLAVEGSNGSPAMDLVSDEVISENFQHKLGLVQPGNKEEKDAIRHALRTLSKARKSELLEAIILSTQAEEEEIQMAPDKAYSYLGATKEADDEGICLQASLMMTDNAGKKREIEAALKTLAEDRNSRVIKFYLEHGEIVSEERLDGMQAPSMDRPVGLENIGNTCYLNSLLQYFFVIKELRNIILNQSQLVQDQMKEGKRVGGRLVTAKEHDRSKKFVRLLADLYNSLIYAQTNAIRPEKELAYLALVTSQDEADTQSTSAPMAEQKFAGEPQPGSSSTLLEAEKNLPTPASSEEVLKDDVVMADATGLAIEEPPLLSRIQPAEHSNNDVEMNGSDMDSDQFVLVDPPEPTDMEKLPSILDSSESAPVYGPFLPGQPPALPPRKSSTNFDQGNTMMFGRQHDVSECMDNVMFQIEVALDADKLAASGQSKTVVQDLFYGITTQTLSFDDDSSQDRHKEEPFSYLLVDVAEEGRDIYEGLDAAFQEQIVEIEGRKVKRKTNISFIPPIIQIQLQRVQFDRKEAKVFKSNAYMAFKPELNMDRYLRPDPEDVAAHARIVATDEYRRRLSQARELSDELQQSQTTTAIENFKAIAGFISKHKEEATAGDVEHLPILADIGNEAKLLEDERERVKSRIDNIRNQIEQIWENVRSAEYELVSVFMHRGQANFGHYWLHQRTTSEEPHRWLKYNDQQVINIKAEEVFADTTGQTNNPYWLTYVRKSHLHLIEAVRRQL